MLVATPRSGDDVCPAEVETIPYEHPALAEVAIIRLQTTGRGKP
jgi:acyl-CoA synthetase (AMP-forming)/AMP-acid ligase II